MFIRTLLDESSLKVIANACYPVTAELQQQV
jgi:hypothetical protein